MSLPNALAECLAVDLDDLLGLVPDKFRHAARYAEGLEIFVEAVKGYCDDVRDRSFNPES